MGVVDEMHACWLGVGERICGDLNSYGGAERASLVLRYGTPVEEESVECF